MRIEAPLGSLSYSRTFISSSVNYVQLTARYPNYKIPTTGPILNNMNPIQALPLIFPEIILILSKSGPLLCHPTDLSDRRFSTSVFHFGACNTSPLSKQLT